jgi:hypothetical protein
MGECEIVEEICSCHINQHFHAANHHARIAELEALVREIFAGDWTDENAEGDLVPIDRRWEFKERAEAALKGGKA